MDSSYLNADPTRRVQQQMSRELGIKTPRWVCLTSIAVQVQSRLCPLINRQGLLQLEKPRHTAAGSVTMSQSHGESSRATRAPLQNGDNDSNRIKILVTGWRK